MYLPSPPTDREKFLYLDQNKALFYGWGFFSFLLLIVGMVVFSFAHANVWIYLIFTALIAVYLGISYWIGIFGRPFNFRIHQAILELYGRYRPSVDIYLPCCGEPIEILENTYKYVRALRWPEGKIHVYVLDDGDDARVRILADRYEFNYLSRPNRGELKKAGNIRHAFAQTSGEFILILDADFCPRPDMLEEMIPHFAYDKSVAIVQSPQFFDVTNEMTWMQRGAAYVQELFYRMVQVNRDTWGASICVGTCAIYRRQALAPHGGTYPIAYSEDLHTGWQAVVDGWKVRYLPINLSKGSCPETMSSYFVQQTRWCTGSTSLLMSRKFWSNPMPLMQRLCFMSGMLYYVATAASVFFTPLPALYVVWFQPQHVFWYNYLFSLPSFIFGTVIVAMWGRLPFGAYVLTSRIVAYYAHFYALLDKLRGSMIAWVPSGDVKAMKSVKRYFDFKRLMFGWVSVSTGLAILGSGLHMKSVLDFNFYPMIFFSVFNYWVSLRALAEES
jgi:cellulose synthase/poly-beta-1,6-N-acetylglucosamine synthase-like glycosyltransferase